MEHFTIPDHEPLPFYADPGGYSVIYCDDEGFVLCADCAERERREDGLKVTGFIHWEGESEWCESCSKELPSEYGIPDADQGAEVADDRS